MFLFKEINEQNNRKALGKERSIRFLLRIMKVKIYYVYDFITKYITF